MLPVLSVSHTAFNGRKKQGRHRERETERDRDQYSLHQNMEVSEKLDSYFRSYRFEQLISSKDINISL